MDAELTKDIRIIKDIRESSASAAKVSAMHQARCESLDRTIARLEAMAAGGGRAEKAEAELAMFRELYDHALDCVDQVFQVCSEIPNPILPNFLMAGSNKFDGVIKLAKSFAAAKQREAKLRELCSKHESMWKYQVLRILDGKEGE